MRTDFLGQRAQQVQMEPRGVPKVPQLVGVARWTSGRLPQTLDSRQEPITLPPEVLPVRWLLPLIFVLACNRVPPAVPVPQTVARAAEPGDAQRMRAAAVTIHFANGTWTPGDAQVGLDRLQVAAVFGDLERGDVGVLADLVGRSSAGLPAPELDTCVRLADPAHNLGPRPGAPPLAYMQLLDVGNVELRAGKQALPLRVQMVPNLFEAARGVRYDVEQDMSRSWLAAGALHVVATGGDGVAPFDVAIDVPRPVRVTWVGSNPVRSGQVPVPPADEDLTLRWGSVDGTADLDLLLGADVPAGLGWLHCRLKDDGEFTVPKALASLLPPHGTEHPWLARLSRSREVPMPGFEALPLRLELSDSAWLQ